MGKTTAGPGNNGRAGATPARKPARARSTLRFHPGFADGTRRTDDHSNAGSQHQGSQLAGADLDTGRGISGALGIGRDGAASDGADSKRMNERKYFVRG